MSVVETSLLIQRKFCCIFFSQKINIKWATICFYFSHLNHVAKMKCHVCIAIISYFVHFKRLAFSILSKLPCTFDNISRYNSSLLHIFFNFEPSRTFVGNKLIKTLFPPNCRDQNMSEYYSAHIYLWKLAPFLHMLKPN